MSISKLKNRLRGSALIAMLTFAVALYGRDISYEHEGITLNYTVLDETAKTVTVKAGTTAAPGNNVQGNLVIPERIESDGVEYTVTEIGNYAFYGCRGIYSVKFPETLVSIGNAAFASNGGLMSLTIPGAVTAIGNGAFSECVMLLDLQLGKSVESIGSGTFINCENIKQLTLPGSLTKLGSSAFSGCKNLQEVILPPLLMSVGNSAFDGCTSLIKCASPSTISTPFPQVETLVSYPSDGAIVENGCVWGPGKSALYYVTRTASGEFDIPSSVSSIGNNAFKDCLYIEKVEMPNSVTELGEKAFSGCSGMSTLKLSDALNSIPKYAFENCSSISNDLKVSCQTIDFGAFTNCISIPKIVFTDSVKYIREHAFKGCTNLSEVEFGDSLESLDWECFYGTNISSATIPASVKSFYAAFLGSNISYVKFLGTTAPSFCAFSQTFANQLLYVPENITVDIPDGSAWSYFSKIGDIRSLNIEGIPARQYEAGGITYSLINNPSGSREAILIKCNYTNLIDVNIDKVSVYNPQEFTEIDYPITGILSYAFRNCENLKKLTIGEDVKYIGGGILFEYGFGGGKIETIIYNAIECSILDGTLPSSITTLIFGEKVKYIPPKLAFGFKQLTSLVIPNSVKEIGRDAFNDCRGLTNLTIGNGVTTIGNLAFFGCTSLPSLTFPGSVEIMGEAVFSDCINLETVILPPRLKAFGQGLSGLNNLKRCAYPSTIANPYGNKGFQYPAEGAVVEDGCVWGPGKSVLYFVSSTKEGEFVIPNSVKSIGPGAFQSCDKITSIVIPNSVESIGENAFSGLAGLTSVTLGNSIETIGSYAFSGCTGLTSISIPNSVESISDNAFYGCTGLTSVTIPNSVTSIGTSTFNGCSGLTSVTIPNSVTSIGRAAFYHCTGLTSVDISNSVTYIDSNVFSGCTGLTSVIIPNSVKSIESNAFAGCMGLRSIVIGHSLESIGNDLFGTYNGYNGVDTLYITSQSAPNIGNSKDQLLKGKIYVQGEEAAKDYAQKWDLNKQPQLMTVADRIEGSIKEVNGEPGDAIQLNAKLLPEDVTLPYIFWKSTNPAVAYVDNNGLVTINELPEDYDGDLTCMIIAESLYADGPTLEIPVNADAWTKAGDSNMDGTVNVTDAVNTANYAVGNEVDNFFFRAADVNKDEKITISDASGTVKIVLTESYSPSRTQRAASGANRMYFSGWNGGVLTVALDNDDECYGFQANLQIPEGCEFETANGKAVVSLTDRADDSYIIVSKLTDGRNLRIGAFSTQHTPISGKSGALLTLKVKNLTDASDGLFTITNALTVDKDDKDMDIEDSSLLVKLVPVTSISLDKTSASLKVGETVTLTATVLPEDATDKTVTWTSSNEDVATVDADGNVTAVALGEATITATCGDVTAICSVSVIPTPVEKIILSETAITMRVRAMQALTATVVPEDATDKTITWTSSDPNVAFYYYGNIYSLEVGEATITATCGDVTATCVVTVVADIVSGIEGLFADGDETADVYTISGLMLKKGCDKAELQQLAPGAYIVRQGLKVTKLIVK